MTRVAVLCGGVGAARFLRGLLEVHDPALVTGVVNVGDDSVIHGMHVSPDLDTITYTLAGAVNPETGWGLVGETWQAMEQVRTYAAASGIGADDEAAGWFSLGDRDLGTHLYRTSRLRAGATLTEVTGEIARTWGLGLSLVPVTDDPVRTWVRTVDGAELSFQEYFVREHHDVAVDEVRYDGIDAALPSPEAAAALEGAGAIVIAPSNPIVSIEPVVGVPGVREALVERRDRTVAVSPIVGGAALKGPADRLMRELELEPTVVGVARWYAEVAATLVVDEQDAELAVAVEAEGVRCIVAPTIMSRPGVGAALARTCLAAATDAA
ncbi:2-phospho-L-lactate transferase [Dermatobacter hominis]|uniref:2-phospho-L-lactate transferase n=1 Tax=Dermatobacter hominis TaxID=2884263 RepID=UPI001D0F8390|nr:2-phospho-L-lactate transferase [Dermatobacter hominis]UDY35602.1 2-phospho-L-lactate transferase [Dermatobacter hominis]